MLGADRIEFWFTDRHGLAGGSGDVSVPTADPRYAGFNLADHVGDDPARVRNHRSELARVVGAPVTFMNQVHGHRVAVIGPGDANGEPPEADALVTQVPGRPLAVLVADCLPILMYQPEVEVCAVVHAGRRGIELGVLEATVSAIGEFGSDPSGIRVLIGPSIGPCCYEVPAAMRDELAAAVPVAAARTTWDTPSIDLRAAARAQLAAVGVQDVAVSPVCTYTSPDHHSYRRDGVTGRFAGIVSLRAAG